jgi:hypothetical protein
MVRCNTEEIKNYSIEHAHKLNVQFLDINTLRTGDGDFRF